MDDDLKTMTIEEYKAYLTDDPFARSQYETIKEHLKKGEEREAAQIISYKFGNDHNSPWNQQTVLSDFWDQFTDPSIQFQMFIDVYINDGYHFPRKLIVKAKRLSKSISESVRLFGLPDGNPVTIYRATKTQGIRVRLEPSWTTDKNTAILFSQRAKLMHGSKNALPIYTGTIERSKIIAFTNDRDEYEVIQHGGVIISGLYEPKETEIKDALSQHANMDKLIDYIKKRIN